MIQFNAGYIIDSIAKIINDFRLGLDRNKPEDQTKLDQINGLLRHVSSFDVSFPENHSIDYHNIHPVLATINNIITRGLPTRSPLLLENLFNEIGLTNQKLDEQEINFSDLKSDIKYKNIFELLHIIEPKLDIPRKDYGGNLGSDGEWNFLNISLKKYPFVKQLFQSQRDFATINKKLDGGRSVDFSFEFPYLNAQNSHLKKKGVIFEFDGILHKIKAYKYYDKYRDDAADEMDFETLRQPSDEIVLDKSITDQFKAEIFSIYEKNFLKEINDYLDEYSLLFIPIAIARIQKTIIEYLLFHQEIFSKSKIEIAIVERDLPCGAIAIKCLHELFFNINAILEEKDKLELPEISLTVFENPKWVVDSRLHLQANLGDEVLFQNKSFDIIIDQSVLRRSNIYNETTYINEQSIKIRSSHFFDTSFGISRRVYCSNLLHYKALVVRDDDGSYVNISEYENHINYFIKTIFRKVSFREGQLPIISRALQLKPVIGLLPTGGGKSLTFQLPAFLQPGLCLVVDPIKSLMEDQVRVLKQHWIDCCDFINSNLKREEKVKKLIDFRFGETMFLFISPERFVMQDFRNIINNIDASKFGLAFSYCVIDEVHCVSEWGHDFRSTYLMLGKNAQKFIKTKSKNVVTLIGLTATASFDVLADIERELQIQHDDIANAIIMIENTIRPELFFRVIDVSGKNRMKELNSDFEELPLNLHVINNEEILRKSQQHHFDEFEKRDFSTKETYFNKDINTVKFEYNGKYLLPNKIYEESYSKLASIIFCPTKGNKRNIKGIITDSRGVPFVFENLESDTKGFFFATDTGELNTEVQNHFLNFILGKINHIVCTKAFGMGIDKSNIRSTYHNYYSSSLEGLVQEVGRSGRDKKISIANILVSKDLIYRLSLKALLFQEPNSKIFKIISDPYHRRELRSLMKKAEFSSKEDLITAIGETVDSLKTFDGGTLIPMSDSEKIILKNRLELFIEGNYSDRDIHNYFFDGNFKGPDVEYSQIHSLFVDREFEVSSNLKVLTDEFNIEFDKDFIFKLWPKTIHKRLYVSDFEDNDFGFINLNSLECLPANEALIQILGFLKKKNGENEDIIKLFNNDICIELNDGTLKEVFNSSTNDTFDYIITAEKIFPNNNETIYAKISEIPEQLKIQQELKTQIKFRRGIGNTFKNLCDNKGGYVSILFKWFSIKEGNPVQVELENAYLSCDDQKFIRIIYIHQIEKAVKLSDNFRDFLLLLEENIKGLKFKFDSNDITEKLLRQYYNRSRYSKPTNDTGRLIYRMHSMGFLENYEIDYNKNNLYNCTFRKYDSIEPYLEKIELYLRRYLSEKSARDLINNENNGLRERVLNNTKITSVIDQIKECLYFLSEFSFKEIASKRKRATDEIENVLNFSITDSIYKADWFKQNLYIKEQIYFYFNAKYARIGFKINGKPFSLLDDYKKPEMNKLEILDKYLKVFREDGTEQNNYKHMMGSCKKILRSLSETDLNNEWLLRLLRAFSMYAVNNISYTSEANTELEQGFDNLYKDESFHGYNFDIIEPIFISYFDKLHENIRVGNPSFEDIKLIRVKLLLKLQTLGLERLINKYNLLKA